MSNDVAHKSWWQIFEVVFGIPFLVAIADPDVALVTSIGKSHLEFFHTVENVFKHPQQELTKNYVNGHFG